MQGLANVIILGRLIAVTGLFSMQEVVTSMEKSIPPSKKDLLELNKKALRLGYDYAG
jgi:2-oxoglutarate ferredoxin oxidoreductase subunit gamma